MRRPARYKPSSYYTKPCLLDQKLFGMLGVFSEFERAMIRDRVMAGLDHARSSGKRLGRPRTTPFKIDRIRAALDEGRGVRETAPLLKISAAKVREVRRTSATASDLHP